MTKISGWLVGAAALLVMTMGMTACSSEGDGILGDNGSEQTTQAAGVRVTVSAGISDGTTRSAVTKDGSTRTLKFTTGDRLYVWKAVEDDYCYVAGMLTMVGAPSANGLSATFTGEVKAYNNNGGEVNNYDFGDDPLDDTMATLVHAGLVEIEGEQDTDYRFIEGGVITFVHNTAADVETLMTKCLVVTGTYSNGGYTLTMDKPIIYCSLSGLAGLTTYVASLQYYNGSSYSRAGYGNFTTDASGAGSVAFVPNEDYEAGKHDWRIEIKHDGTTVGTIDLGNRELAASKVYNVTRHYGQSAFGKFVDLSTVTTTDGNGMLYYAAQDGDVLTGEFSDYFNGEAYVTIADGATVTLAGVDFMAPDNCDHAAIHCLGNATIIVGHKAGAEGTNNDYNCVGAGIDSSYPAVYVPAGKTLTISGTGRLWANGINGYGAGIGGGYDYNSVTAIDCGNIVIAGGIIEALGGSEAAGIGSGQNASCGGITVSGGTISQAQGGDYAAGIGCGQGGQCGDITITDGITIVKATKGDNAMYIIGGGSKWGTVTISGVTMTDYQLQHGLIGPIGNLTSYSDNNTWDLYHQSNE